MRLAYLHADLRQSRPFSLVHPPRFSRPGRPCYSPREVFLLKAKAWFTALRAHFLTATVAPVLVGTAAAWFAAGSFSLSAFVLALLGCILIHLGANMSNDYFDSQSETDAKNLSASAYSGGSRVIQEGLLSARQILAAAITCIVLGSLIGMWLVVTQHNLPLVVIGVIGVFCAWFYTAAPLRLGYKGLAEVLNGVSFGPLVAMGAFAVQAPLWSTTAFVASVPPGILLAAVLMINEFPDHDADKAVGKRTIVVLLGKPRAVLVFQGAILFAFLWVVVFVIAGVFPPWALFTLLSAPLAVRAFLISRRHYSDDRRLAAANMSTFFLHLAFNLLLALGLMLG
jgi:1,4-dihydroxy-2-naphthoate polyprenyltransferase